MVLVAHLCAPDPAPVRSISLTDEHPVHLIYISYGVYL